jgi:hypothetical protein
LLQEIRELCLRTQKETIELAEILAKSPQGLEGELSLSSYIKTIPTVKQEQ